ncbi:hypothetical protein RB195_009323 [Necator americanus]|uniref:Tudor domain-containing protein n=1 Tax=Necator americanus TaxID=51031 RepID=A0ABR1CTM2_NECAM
MSFQWEHNPPIPLPENAVGRFAMIRLPDYRGSMRWMRGMIVSRQKTFVEVFVIDIGGKVAMPFSSLFKVGIEWIPIPPQAFPVRLINSSLQLSPIDVNQLLWKKVNVRIESFDETDFLCDELKFYTVEKDLVDLSDIQDKKLESFIIDKEYNAGGNFDLIGGRSTNSKIQIPAILVASMGLCLAARTKIAKVHNEDHMDSCFTYFSKTTAAAFLIHADFFHSQSANYLPCPATVLYRDHNAIYYHTLPDVHQ